MSRSTMTFARPGPGLRLLSTSAEAREARVETVTVEAGDIDDRIYDLLGKEMMATARAPAAVVLGVRAAMQLAAKVGFPTDHFGTIPVSVAPELPPDAIAIAYPVADGIHIGLGRRADEREP